MSNINFDNRISEVHVTIKESSKRDDIITFLSEKYEIPKTEIVVYSTCEELVKKCFND